MALAPGDSRRLSAQAAGTAALPVLVATLVLTFSRGAILVAGGALLVYAAVTFDPAQSSGLDGALRTILDAPFGRFLLTLVALGIAAFGAYLLVRARYPERT